MTTNQGYIRYISRYDGKFFKTLTERNAYDADYIKAARKLEKKIQDAKERARKKAAQDEIATDIKNLKQKINDYAEQFDIAPFLTFIFGDGYNNIIEFLCR